VVRLYFYDIATGKSVEVPLDWENGIGSDLAVTPDGFVVGLAAGARYDTSRYQRTKSGDAWSWKHTSLEGEQVNVCRFVEFENEVFFLPIVFSIVLLADGKYSTDRMIVVAEADGQRGLDAATASKSAWETAMGWGPQAGTFFALSLLHCKNVSTTTHDPPAAVVRKRLRYGREALTTFKTLEIGSVTKQINENNPGGADGLSRALHMCRGHFKEFAPEKPLFGRLAGRFWWPSHARGNIASGQIIKDYAVKP
jgi:hypothetical protein